VLYSGHFLLILAPFTEISPRSLSPLMGVETRTTVASWNISWLGRTSVNTAPLVCVSYRKRRSSDCQKA